MFKSMFSMHPSQSFQALLLEYRPPSAAIKTSYSRYGIFRPPWSKIGESTLKPGARRAGDADGYGPKLRKPGENRRFTVNAPAAFVPPRLPSGFDDEGLTVQDHVALDGLKQDIDQACANFSRIEQQAAAVHAYTEGRHAAPPNLQVNAQEALAQIDLMTEQLARRTNDIEVASLGRVLPPGIAQNGKGTPAQQSRLTGKPVTPALPPSRRENWKLVTLASLRPERALPANRASSRSGPEGVLRLQLNQLAQKQLAQRNVGQPAGARTVALRDKLGRIADTLQGHRKDVGEELQMKMERRKSRAPKSELPLPALTPKEKKKDGG
jgi:hypothetical protein